MVQFEFGRGFDEGKNDTHNAELLGYSPLGTCSL